MIGTIRKSGNSFVITIPREEMERVGVDAGDHVLVEIRPVDIRVRLTPELTRMADELLEHPETSAAFALLADNQVGRGPLPDSR
jgi:antitoxin component of MazEF toxin-antitoxin module